MPGRTEVNGGLRESKSGVRDRPDGILRDNLARAPNDVGDAAHVHQAALCSQGRKAALFDTRSGPFGSVKLTLHGVEICLM